MSATVRACSLRTKTTFLILSSRKVSLATIKSQIFSCATSARTILRRTRSACHGVMRTKVRPAEKFRRRPERRLRLRQNSINITAPRAAKLFTSSWCNWLRRPPARHFFRSKQMTTDSPGQNANGVTTRDGAGAPRLATQADPAAVAALPPERREKFDAWLAAEQELNARVADCDGAALQLETAISDRNAYVAAFAQKHARVISR